MADRSATGRRGCFPPPCGGTSTNTPKAPNRQGFWAERELGLARHPDVPSNSAAKVGRRVPAGGVVNDNNCSRGGVRGPITDHGNGSRSRTKSARHLPQSCPQKQNAAHHLPGERGQAAGSRYLVR